MRCSPQEELNRDGPGEEIDGEVCSWGKNRGAVNWSDGGAGYSGGGVSELGEGGTGW